MLILRTICYLLNCRIIFASSSEFTFSRPLVFWIKSSKTSSLLITEILSSSDNPDYSMVEKIEEIYKIIDDGKEIKFDKKRSLFDESESGFNMEDVLNPGKLDLMSLCKELGATDWCFI